MKTTSLPIAAMGMGSELAAPGIRSMTRRVPAPVPSVTHSSLPIASVAEKNTSGPATTK